MDYKKFNRTNVIIELVGSIIAVVWSVIALFSAEDYAFAPYTPVMLAFIIKGVRILALTGREDYTQESYYESQKNSYMDNRTLHIVPVACSGVALVLVTIKVFVL